MDVAWSNEDCSVPEFNAGPSKDFIGSKSQFVRDLLRNRMKSKQYSISDSSEIHRKESVQSMVRRRVLGLPKYKRPKVSPVIGKGDSLLGLRFQYQPPSTSTTHSYQPFFSPSQHSTAPTKKEVEISQEQDEQRKKLHLFQQQKLKQIEEESRRKEQQRHLESCQANALRLKRKLAKQAILENLAKKKQNDEAYNKKVYNEWLKNQRISNGIIKSRSCPEYESFQSLSPEIEQIHNPDVFFNSLQVDTNAPCSGSATNQEFANKATNIESMKNQDERCTVLLSFSETVSSSQVTGLPKAASTPRNVGYSSSDQDPALDNTENRQDRGTRKGDRLKDIGYLSSLLELSDAAPDTTEGLAALELVVAQAVLLDQRALATLLVGRTLVLTEAGQRALAVARMQEEPILPVPVRRALHEQKSSEDLERLRDESSEIRHHTLLSPRCGRREKRQNEPLDKRREQPIKTSKNTCFSDKQDGLLHLRDESSICVGNPAGWSLNDLVHESPHLVDHIPSNQDIPTRDVMIGGRNSFHAMNHSIDPGCFSSKTFAEASISYGFTDALTVGTSSTDDMFPEVGLGNESLHQPWTAVQQPLHDYPHLPAAAPVTLLAEDGTRLFMENFDVGQCNRLTPEEFVAINGDGNGPIMGRVVPKSTVCHIPTDFPERVK